MNARFTTLWLFALAAACGEPQPADGVEDEVAGDAVSCADDEILDPTTGLCAPVEFERSTTSAGLVAHVGTLDIEIDPLPATLPEGFDTPLTVKIVNTGPLLQSSRITQLRVLATPASSNALDRYLRAAADKTLCENTGNTSYACDVGASYNPAPVGTDCGDCRPLDRAIDGCRVRRSIEGDDWYCLDESFQCNRLTNNCEPKLIALGEVSVDIWGLDPRRGPDGQEVKIPLHVKRNEKDAYGKRLSSLGPLQLVLAVNEAPVVQTIDVTTRTVRGYQADPNRPIDPRKSSLQNAEAVVKLGGAQVVVPNGFDVALIDAAVETGQAGGVGAVRPSNYAFELDASARQDEPAFRVRLRIQTRGKDAIYDEFGYRAIPIRFTLKLPGHVGNPGWETSPAPTFSYSADRTFELDVEGYLGALGGHDNDYDPQVYSPVTATLPTSALVGGGEYKDVDYVLRLSRRDTKLLAETGRKGVRDSYPRWIIRQPGDEILGTLEVKIEPGMEVDPLGDAARNNTATMSVVFMIPPAPRDALVTDPDDPVATYQPADAEKIGPYTEVDHYTPTEYDHMGGEWLGAAYQVKNLGSKERKYGAIVKQRIEADDFVKAWFLQVQYIFLAISGHADFGTQRLAQNNRAELSLTLMNDRLVDLKADFNNDCTDMEGVTTCSLAKLNVDEEEEEDPPNVPLVTFTPPGGETQTSKEWVKEFEKEICYKKLICLQGKIEATATLGLRGGVEFERDPSFGRTRTKLTAGFGPFVKLEGTAHGFVSVTVARAGLEGQITFLDADFIPTVEAEVSQQEATAVEADNYNEGKPCWMENEGRIAFIGKAKLKALSGSVAAVFYAGVNKCLFGLCANFEFEVWRLKLVEWDAALEKEWRLWDEAVALRGQGICKTAPHLDHAWKTPKGCKTPLGADAYCSNSSNLGASPYAHRFYMGPSGCARLTVDGDVHLGGDWLDVVGVYDTGLQNSTRDPHIELERQSDCRLTPIVLNGTVGQRQEPLDRPLDCENVPPRSNIRLSGDFDNHRLLVCDTREYEGGQDGLGPFAAVDLVLNTDATGVQRGLDVKIDRLDPPDDNVYSDETWRIAPYDYPEPQKVGWALLAKSGTRTEGGVVPWVRPGVLCCDGGPAFGVFTANERNTKINYLTSPGRVPGDQYEEKTVLFRRPFLPTGGKYKVLLQCDDVCNLWVDAKLIANAKFDRYAYVEVGTGDTEGFIKEGQMQMLAMSLRNEGGGGWVRMAMKKVAE